MLSPEQARIKELEEMRNMNTELITELTNALREKGKRCEELEAELENEKPAECTACETGTSMCEDEIADLTEKLRTAEKYIKGLETRAGELTKKSAELAALKKRIAGLAEQMKQRSNSEKRTISLLERAGQTVAAQCAEEAKKNFAQCAEWTLELLEGGK